MVIARWSFRLYPACLAANFILFLNGLAGIGGLQVLRAEGLLALVLTSVAAWRTGDPRALLTPALPLAAVADLFVLTLPGYPAKFGALGVRYADAMAADGLLAGRILACFCAAALTASLFVSFRWARPPGRIRTSPGLALPIGLTAAAVILAAIYGVGYTSEHDFLTPLLGAVLAGNIYQAVPPLLSLIMAFLALQVPGAPRVLPLLVAVAAALVAALVATSFIRTALMATAAVLVLLFLVPGRLDRRILVIGAVAMLLTGIAGVLAVHKRRIGFEGDMTALAARAVTDKVGERFTVTFSCLSQGLARTLNAPPRRTPVYFFSGLVPRVLWPDKPALSWGDFYTVAYCDVPILDPAHPGSMSVTLLGEPLIEAGWPGFFAAGVAWLALVLGFTRLCMKLGAPGMGWMAAMIPWLADFDQSFTMYCALGVKTALIMAPFIAVWWWWNGRSQGA